MSNSLIDLRTRMAGKSVTLGWGAVVSMNRAKVNDLLEQQYINRFNRDSYLKAISDTISTHVDGNELLQLQSVVLSKPILSFTNANLDSSTALLKMDIVSGAFARLVDAAGLPRRVLSSFNITPQQQFKVEMSIDLHKVNGYQNNGLVVLDLGQGYNFTCNMVDDELSQLRLGAFFKDLFQRQPEEFRRYELGVFDYVPDTLLAPRDFIIRTQAAPEGKDPRSDSYGDGAVVLLVQTITDLHPGDLPTQATFPYLIPDDKDTEGNPVYSCSLVLSSLAFFDLFVRRDFDEKIGHGLRLFTSTSAQLATVLSADSGGLNITVGKAWVKQNTPGMDHKHSLTSIDNGFIAFAGPRDQEVMTVTSSESGLHVGWRRSLVHSIRHEIENSVGMVTDYTHRARVEIELSVYFEPEVDPLTNKVSFRRRIAMSRGEFMFSNPGESDRDFQVPYNIRQEINDESSHAIQTLFSAIAELEFSELNLFAISHLLFPEQHTLFLSEAYLPGDLFMVGKLDPSLTSIGIAPLNSIIAAGSAQQFQVRNQRKGIQNLTWSVRSTDGTLAMGEINENGLFTAPQASRINGRAVRNVVTASGQAQDGTTVSTSAMVVIASESIGTYPEMFTIDMAAPRPIDLTAWSLGAGPFTWRLGSQPGNLVANGERATYTPPDNVEEITVVEIEVEDQSSRMRSLATVLLLKGMYALDVFPAYVPLMPAAGQYTFKGPEDFEPGELKWSIVSGQGEIDEVSGLYTAPDEVRQPYVLIQAIEDRIILPHKGYALLHLSRYANPARWTSLSPFQLKLASTSNKLYGNGQQQVAIRVEVQGRDGSALEEISDEELDSIVLVTARTHQPLRTVGKSGVGKDDDHKWGVNDKPNGFVYHPDVVHTSDAAPRLREKVFYVQTRDFNPLDIAAQLTSDYQIKHYSDEDGGSEENKTIFTAQPRPVPNFGSNSFKLVSRRVQGGSDNDQYLITVDYYELSLELNEQRIRLVDFRFEGRPCMWQWESKQLEEDLCSFTGFYDPSAPTDPEYPGELGALLFDAALLTHIPKTLQPSRRLLDGYTPADGVVLFSLHRVVDFMFMRNEAEHAKPIVVIVTDHFGSEHKVQINFKAIDDRHELTHRVVG